MQKNMMWVKITEMDKCIYAILRTFLRCDRSCVTFLS